MPSRRLQMAVFVSGCSSMFSGSFQNNFLPSSIDTKPVKGQNEAWSLAEEGQAVWTRRQREDVKGV